MSTERERLLNDPTAVDALYRWAERNGDSFCEAVALSRMAPHADRFLEIAWLAEGLSEDEVTQLDAELSDWPEELRRATRWFGSDFERPALLIARQVYINEPSTVETLRSLAQTPWSCNLRDLDVLWGIRRTLRRCLLASPPPLLSFVN